MTRRDDVATTLETVMAAAIRGFLSCTNPSAHRVLGGATDTR